MLKILALFPVCDPSKYGYNCDNDCGCDNGCDMSGDCLPFCGVGMHGDPGGSTCINGKKLFFELCLDRSL
jgi:hypothetical protein